MRIVAVFACAVLIAQAAPAVAQDAPAAGVTTSPSTTSGKAFDLGRPPGADQPAANGKEASTTLPGVTVTKRKPCWRHDTACIEQVTAEIWRQYPTQIQAMCDKETIGRIGTAFLAEGLGMSDTAGTLTHMTPETQALCQYGSAHGLTKSAERR
jgi:hypothetical protein